MRRHGLTRPPQATRASSADARAKLGLLLGFLIAVSSVAIDRANGAAMLAYGAILLVVAVAARASLLSILLRAALVLPFSATLAVIVFWAGNPARAIVMLEKSYLSAAAAALFIATTPVEQWTTALQQWRCPQVLILVVHFLYRYLFLLLDQARRMALASALRGPRRSTFSRASFRLAGGALAVLFARSWQRADGVYHAMLSRGFRGHFWRSEEAPFGASDAWLVATGLLAIAVVRYTF